MFLPIPQWRPDVSDYQGEHTQTLQNVVPRGDGYGPIKALGAYSQPLSSGNDSFTKVLLHFDGADAATTITDSNSGGSAHTWTAAGNAQIDTAQYKFGGASGLFDGTGDWVTTADHADYALGSGAFTVDFFFRCNVAGGSIEELAGQQDSSATNTTRSFRVRRNASNFIEATVTVGTTDTTVTGTTEFTDATNTGWHHVALVRSSNTLYLFVDGVLEDSDTITGTVNDSSNALRVGAAGEVTANPWTGWIDEFRLSVGVARWTAAFTAPQKPHDTAANGVCRGEFRARQTDGTIAIFAATSTNLFKLNNTTLDWEQVSKNATAYSAVPSTDNWWIDQFGSVVVAGQANTAPQAYTLGSSTYFADLGGSPPTARYGAVMGRFLVLTGLTANPLRVHNSGLDAITTWTAGTNFANTVDLPDGGVVRGAVGGEFGLVFQENAVRRGVYVPGGTPAFQLERITDEVGIFGAYSAVRALDQIFFFTQKGFLKYPGLVLIGKERVDRTFAAELDSGNLQLFIGASDPKETRVYWGYKTLSNSASTFDKLIIYDYALDRWSTANVTGEYLASIVTPGLTLEGLDSINPSLDALEFSLDSVAAAVAASLSAFNSSHELAFFDGANLEAIVETAERALPNGRRGRVTGLRPISDAPTIYGALKHRATQQASFQTTSETLVNSNGVCPQNKDTRYGRARLRIPAGTVWTSLTGVEVETGDRPTGKQ